MPATLINIQHPLDDKCTHLVSVREIHWTEDIWGSRDCIGSNLVTVVADNLDQWRCANCTAYETLYRMRFGQKHGGQTVRYVEYILCESCLRVIATDYGYSVIARDGELLLFKSAPEGGSNGD